MQQTTVGKLRTLAAGLAAFALGGAPSAGAQTTFEWLQGGNFEQMQFVDSSHGFVTGDGGRIHASDDGGLTWEEVNTVDGNPEVWGNVHGMHFRGTWGTSSFKGWAASSNGVVLRTTDTEGLIWEYANPTSRITSQLAEKADLSDLGTHYAVLRDIFMVDDLRGVVVGDDGAFATTTNGGVDWNIHVIDGVFGAGADPNDVYQIHFFKNSGPGFADYDKAALATEYGRIFKSESNVDHVGGGAWFPEPVHAGGPNCDGDNLPPLMLEHAAGGSNLELWEMAFEDPEDADSPITVVGGVGNSNGYIFRRLGGWTLDACTAWSQERDYNFVDPGASDHLSVCGIQTLYSVDVLDTTATTPNLVAAGYAGLLFTREANAQINFEYTSVEPFCAALNCMQVQCPTGTAWVQQETIDDDGTGVSLMMPFGNRAALLAGARVTDDVAVFAGHFGVITRLDLEALNPADVVQEVGARWVVRVADGWFVDSLTGHVVGQLGFVLKTVDGGVTWSLPSVDWTLPGPAGSVNGEVAYINAVSFSDSGQYGVLVGTGGHIAWTDDHGATWSDVLQSNGSHATDEEMRDVSYVKGTLNTFYACGGSGRVILSTDGGKNWVDRRIDLPDVDTIEAVSFAPPQPITQPPTPPTLGYAVSSDERIYRTTNGGVTWGAVRVSDEISETRPEDLTDVVTWGDGSQAVAVGRDGSVFEKTGTSFVRQHLGAVTVKEDLLDVEALASGAHLRISGRGGVVLFRDNGVWTRPRSRTTQDLFKLSFLSPDEGFGLGERSLVIRYDDT